MQDFESRRPLVYLGPSLSPTEAAAILPDAHFRPQVVRHDLHRDREAGGNIFVIIDGGFAQNLPVSPREVANILHDGALVFGASSMGAIRAAECWPLGMRGVGTVYRMFRSGALDTDDEVAVAVDPNNSEKALSVALINIRYALSLARRKRLIDEARARKVLEVAQSMHFSERQWGAILRLAGIDKARDQRLATFLPEQDLKKRDALRVLQVVASLVKARPELGDDHTRKGREAFAELIRYRLDRWLGRDPELAQRELFVWVFGVGRYQKFFWPLLVGHPELHGLEHPAEEHAGKIREVLPRLLRQLTDAVEDSAARLWHEMDFMDEVDAEYTRMHSVRTLAASARARGIAVSRELLDNTRDEVAINHGTPHWTALLASVDEGRLFGAIPLEWIEASAVDLAHARAWRP